MKRFIIPIFISHKGCRHKCIFCNQYNIAGDSDSPGEIPFIVKKYIDTQYEKFGEINPKYKKKQISFYGGSFTCMPRETMTEYLIEAKKFLKQHYGELQDSGKYRIIDSMRLSTRPDCIDESIAEFLKKNSVETVEIGAQSLEDTLLESLNRGHTLKQIINACEILKKFKFETGIQLMVGVPRETKKKLEKMAELLVDKLKPDFVRIYPLLVIKGTVVEKMFLNGEYNPLSNEEAVERALIFADICQKNNIEVIRVGLQPTINLSKNVVSGPFTHNIGEIVRNKIN